MARHTVVKVRDIKKKVIEAKRCIRRGVKGQRNSRVCGERSIG
jgi:hypothetical protein